MMYLLATQKKKIRKPSLSLSKNNQKTNGVEINLKGPVHQ